MHEQTVFKTLQDDKVRIKLLAMRLIECMQWTAQRAQDKNGEYHQINTEEFMSVNALEQYGNREMKEAYDECPDTAPDWIRE